jgi:hypothetical protein
MFAVFNRQTDSSGNRCNPLGSDRQFRIAIDAVSACDRISQFYPTGVNVHPDGTCELFYNDDPRVRIERLFSNQTRTAVGVLDENE